MPQQITRPVKGLVEAARAEIQEIAPTDAMALAGDAATVFVDLRDPRELERDGKIEGAFHCPRGMLEFWIDPASPYHKPIFAQDKRFVFYCASGWRSALSAKAAQDMGLKPVAHIAGGLMAWKAAGGTVVTPDKT